MKRFLPVFIGVFLTATLLAVLAYLASKRIAEISAVPTLSIISPKMNEAVDSPLVVRFTASTPVALRPTGWGVANLHLHAWVNDQQIMPAAADIHDLGAMMYEWKMPAVGRDRAIRLHLGWADMAHKPVPEGNSDEIQFDLH